jgi:tetratricopeptide (TPR) repeat protein
MILDQIQQVESRLATAPRTAETAAFQGEVEYRKGHFEEADKLYRSALQMNEKTARAHFGLGKLALAKLKSADAVKLFSKAIELDAKEPIYHFYISDALTLERKSKEAEQQLQEYLKLNPTDPDRVAAPVRRSRGPSHGHPSSFADQRRSRWIQGPRDRGSLLRR